MSSINVYIGRVIILINDRYPLYFEEIYAFEVKMDRKIFIRGDTQKAQISNNIPIIST